ncbi:hypothetical protein FOPG_20119 [Fusarium oxysporum f. sp. conglutinans race 2 54008]|uniref:Uncharacterized protein n=2 Tax=Fusarium oxysporum f. sp. conglutinans TaxID=100902 RepID=F9FZU6_FUSOF|nr:hypothetical protein FOXB_11928 [Fusarium oxysporum f. sp. conglutinans Fo5176]EXL63607.1 hypothetical protein FOPG_20119 [Fusarium oxysporum f. sp. conglutinans race 2 54008]
MVTDQRPWLLLTITSESETNSIPLGMNTSESDEDHLSPFARLTQRQPCDSGNERCKSASPVSSRRGLSSLSKSSAGSSQAPSRYPGSMRSRGKSIRSSAIGNSTHGNTRDLDTYSHGIFFWDYKRSFHGFKVFTKKAFSLVH